MSITFTVFGIPVPKGSTRSFAMMGKNGKPYAVTTAANPKTKSWQESVTTVAQGHAPKGGPLAGPVHLSAVFVMPRPKSLPKKVVHHTKKPDLDKLLRAIKDALKGVIYKDDSQVVSVIASKCYEKDTGVTIIVKEYPQSTSSGSRHPDPATCGLHIDS